MAENHNTTATETTVFRTIPLTKGMVALVSPEDFEALSKFKWHASRQSRGYYYAVRSGSIITEGGRKIRMHRQIMGAGPHVQIDHKDNNGLNNQRANLREATSAQNRWNTKLLANNKSGFKGVSFHIREQKWVAKITVNGKRRHIGVFPSAEEAGAAYAREALRLQGEFAWENLSKVAHREVKP